MRAHILMIAITVAAAAPVVAQTVRITEQPVVSRPAPFTSGQTVVVPRTTIEVDEAAPAISRAPVTTAPIPPTSEHTPHAPADGATIDGVFVRRGEPLTVVLPDRVGESALRRALALHQLSEVEIADVVAAARRAGKLAR